jgi:hypothetical protein
MKNPVPARWIAAALLVGVPVAWGLIKWHNKYSIVAALITLAVFWMLVLVLLEWAGRKDGNPNRSKYGFIDVVIGADGRVSTSQTVAYVWTFVFASALVIMTSMVVFGYLTPDQAFQTGSNWDAYLLLLGGPFASAIIAKGIVSYQTQQDPDSKSGTTAASSTANTMTTTVAGQPSVTDIVSGDSGAPSLVDTQYSIFSLIAILYFAGLFISNLDQYAVGKTNLEWLPQIPSALIGLTSLAALTYVGNKAVQTQGLRVVSFSPPSPTAGSTVVAALVNLPATATNQTTSIWIKDASGIITSVGPEGVDAAKNTVSFQAPAAGTYSVTIAGPDTFTGPVPLVVEPAAAGTATV